MALYPFGVEVYAEAGSGGDFDFAVCHLQGRGFAFEADIGFQLFEFVMSAGVGDGRDELDVVEIAQPPPDMCGTTVLPNAAAIRATFMERIRPPK